MTSLLSLFMLTSVSLTSFTDIPYFRDYNEAYYTYFADNNPHLSPSQVVTYVNTGIHRPFHEGIVFVDDPYYIGVLVDKYRRLPSNFTPRDLVPIGGGHYMRQPAATAFANMRSTMYDAGLPVVIRSAYRSYATQTGIVNTNLAAFGQEFVDMWNARPGHSEHQLGLAIDIVQPNVTGNLSSAHFETTQHYAWLNQNAHNFGFILSYPYGYSYITGYAFEPWHWRYVGVQRATYMFNNNIPTLQHYFATRYDATAWAQLQAYRQQQYTTQPT